MKSKIYNRYNRIVGNNDPRRTIYQVPELIDYHLVVEVSYRIVNGFNFERDISTADFESKSFAYRPSEVLNNDLGKR